MEFKFLAWWDKKLIPVGRLEFFEKMHIANDELINPNLLMCVGIKDSDGKETYSGFIIEFNHGGKRTVAEVTYEAPAFCLRIIESPFYTKGVVILWDQLFFKNPKIIGNIYEGYTK